MDSIQKERFKPVLIIIGIKVFCFYTILMLFNAKTYLIGDIDSLPALLEAVFFSNVMLKVLALTCGTGVLYLLTAIPAAIICYIIERTIGKEISAVYCFYIAILLSVMFFSRYLIDYDELYLSYLVFLPYELLAGSLKKNIGCLGLWGIVGVVIFALYGTFQYLEALDNPVSVEGESRVGVHKDKVYICPTKTSKVFHKDKSCKALNRCSKQIKTVSLDEAVRMGRRKCKICY